MAPLTWYLGPIGNLVQIPAPAKPAEVPHAIPGGVLEALGGAVTVDRTGYAARSWRMEWPYLTEDNLTYLEAVGNGLVKGPLRLLDPMRRNRLPRRIAAAGSLRRSATDFTKTVGNTPTWGGAAGSAPPGRGPPPRGGEPAGRGWGRRIRRPRCRWGARSRGSGPPPRPGASRRRPVRTGCRASWGSRSGPRSGSVTRRSRQRQRSTLGTRRGLRLGLLARPRR